MRKERKNGVKTNSKISKTEDIYWNFLKLHEKFLEVLIILMF
jgi:hypothetical protein